MTRKPQWITSLPLLIGLLSLLLSACSSPATGAPPAGPGTTVLTLPSSQTPTTSTPTRVQVIQLLLQSAQAMSAVKSVHLLATSSGTLLSANGALPALNQQQSIPYRLKLSSDVDLATQQQQGHLQLSLSPAGQPPIALNIMEVLAGQKLFSSNAAATKNTTATTASGWMVMDLARLVTMGQVAEASNLAQNLLPLLAQQVAATDHGIITLAGVQVRHVTLVLSQQALTQIAAQANQPQVKPFLQSIQLQTPLTLDVFINPASSLVQQVSVKGHITVNVDQLTGGNTAQTNAQARTLQVAMKGTTITFTQYNQPVQIRVPATRGTPVPLG